MTLDQVRAVLCSVPAGSLEYRAISFEGGYLVEVVSGDPVEHRAIYRLLQPEENLERNNRHYKTIDLVRFRWKDILEDIAHAVGR